MAEPEQTDFTDLIERWIVVKKSIPTLETGAYANGDVLCATQKLENVVPADGGAGVIVSVELIDRKDLARAITVYFLDGNVAMGVVNSAITMSAANSQYNAGHVKFVATDYEDLVNSRVANKSSLGMGFKCGSDSRHLYYTLVLRDAAGATYSADSLVLKVTILPAM